MKSGERRTKRAADAAIAIALAAAALFFWKLRIIDSAARAVHIGNVDLFTQIYPMQQRAFRSLLEGAIPLWNPHQYAGQPLLASFQYGILYPLNFPHLFLPTELAIEFTTVLHFTAAGLFAYLYARAIGMRKLAAVGCGAMFMFAPHMVGMAIWYTPIFCASSSCDTLSATVSSPRFE